MLGFRDLLTQAIANIRSEKSVLTDSSRELALNHLEGLMIENKTSDAHLILDIHLTLGDIKRKKTYGICGISLFGVNGSCYFNEMTKVLKSTVRGLGLLSWEKMTEKLYDSMDQELANAYIGFYQSLIKTTCNFTGCHHEEKIAQDIIAEAQTLFAKVRDSNNKEPDQSKVIFLNLMQAFIEDAVRLQPKPAVKSGLQLVN
jgi:hypothetical protein